MRSPLQVTQNDRCAVSIRQLVDLFVNRLRRGFSTNPTRNDCRSARGGLTFVGAPASLRRAGTTGDPVGNAMQPRTERVLNPERPGPLDQDEKRGLKRVLHVVRIAEGRSTDSQHKRAVPLNERRERQLANFSIAGRESLEQLPVC
jgi:hypothetical protein